MMVGILAEDERLRAEMVPPDTPIQIHTNQCADCVVVNRFPRIVVDIHVILQYEVPWAGY